METFKHPQIRPTIEQATVPPVVKEFFRRLDAGEPLPPEFTIYKLSGKPHKLEQQPIPSE
jgi:hypothetical protein